MNSLRMAYFRLRTTGDVRDPYPESWSENWYDSDDVYVDYDDGYYLYNRRQPRVRLAISIVL